MRGEDELLTPPPTLVRYKERSFSILKETEGEDNKRLQSNLLFLYIYQDVIKKIRGVVTAGSTPGCTAEAPYRSLRYKGGCPPTLWLHPSFVRL